jgi:hypothetical protein
MPKGRVAIYTTYLLAVAVCVSPAFEFKESIDATWTFIIVLLTLPSSFLIGFFPLSLIHGAGLAFFAFIHLASAGLNVYLVNDLVNYFREGNK